MFYVKLLIILVCVKLAGDLSARVGQPPVLGKLLVGVLVGPAVLGWIEYDDLIHQFAEIGVLLLMFVAGLETDLNELNRNRNSSLAVAVGGVIFPLLFGYLAGKLIGVNDTEAIFFGLLLSATSVSISVQTLKDIGKLQTRESVTILGAAVVDDILVVILLAFMTSFMLETPGADESVLLVIGKQVLFFVLVFLIGWKLIPWLMRLMSKLKVTYVIASGGLIACFGLAALGESLGVAGIIGSFAAGLALSRTEYKAEVERSVEPIAYTIFVPVFFVNIGLSVTFEGLGDQIWFIVGMTILAILTKLIGCGLGARMTGFNTSSSIAIGSGMISRGEVALIIAQLGLEAKILPVEYYTAMIIVVILTTIVTPPLLKKTFV